LLLAVLTADCIPVILVDTKTCGGVFHAGWRGTAKRIVEKGGVKCAAALAPGRAISRLPSARRPQLLLLGGEEVRAQFESQFDYADKLFHEVKESDPIREKYPLLFYSPGAGA
jgi:copper oxidase (laccase) domain-containing protein